MSKPISGLITLVIIIAGGLALVWYFLVKRKTTPAPVDAPKPSQDTATPEQGFYHIAPVMGEQVTPVSTAVIEPAKSSPALLIPETSINAAISGAVAVSPNPGVIDLAMVNLVNANLAGEDRNNPGQCLPGQTRNPFGICQGAVNMSQGEIDYANATQNIGIIDSNTGAVRMVGYDEWLNLVNNMG